MKIGCVVQLTVDSVQNQVWSPQLSVGYFPNRLQRSILQHIITNHRPHHKGTSPHPAVPAANLQPTGPHPMGKFGRDQGASPHPAGTIGQPAATGPHPAAKPVFFSSIKRCDGNWSLDHPSSKGAPRSRGPAQTSALAVLCAQQHSRAPARERNHLTHATCARPTHDVLCAQLSAIRLHCVRSRCASARPAHVAHAPLRPPPRSVVSAPPHAAQRRRAAQPPSVPPRGMHPRPSAHPWASRSPVPPVFALARIAAVRRGDGLERADG